MLLGSRLSLAALAFVAASPAFAFLISFPVSVTEYVNDANGRHVLLTDPAEIAMVESGLVGPWRSTGYVFEAGSSLAGGLYVDVCRFYAPAPGEHFYTADPAECEGLKRAGSGWIFEGTPFNAIPPPCGALRSPVYRLWNGHPYPDVDHRFTPDPALREALIAQGWVDEGVAFCADGWSMVPAKSFSLAPAAAKPRAECENESLNLGGACVALDELAPMANEIPIFLPPSYTVLNPRWRDTFTSYTATSVDLWTAQSPDDPAAVQAHSFAQFGKGWGPELGVRLSAADRTAWPWRSVSPMYKFATTAPAPGAKDARVFPWSNTREHHLEIAFSVESVAFIRRGTVDSHAYGLPVIRFRDATSGARVQLAIEAFGTLTPGEGIGRDARTGDVIIATAFQDATQYGKRLSGAFVACDGNAASGSCPGFTAAATPFRFRVDRDDFERVVAAARAANPALSANVADYMLDEFEFRAETYLDGELGMHLSVPTLEIWGS